MASSADHTRRRLDAFCLPLVDAIAPFNSCHEQMILDFFFNHLNQFPATEEYCFHIRKNKYIKKNILQYIKSFIKIIIIALFWFAECAKLFFFANLAAIHFIRTCHKHKCESLLTNIAWAPFHPQAGMRVRACAYPYRPFCPAAVENVVRRAGWRRRSKHRSPGWSNTSRTSRLQTHVNKSIGTPSSLTASQNAKTVKNRFVLIFL